MLMCNFCAGPNSAKARDKFPLKSRKIRETQTFLKLDECRSNMYQGREGNYFRDRSGIEVKTRNASMQELAYWDTILGTYENTLLKLHEKLKRELREAHYSGRDELCRKVRISCEKTADLIHHYRHMLGTVQRT